MAIDFEISLVINVENAKMIAEALIRNSSQVDTKSAPHPYLPWFGELHRGGSTADHLGSKHLAAAIRRGFTPTLIFPLLLWPTARPGSSRSQWSRTQRAHKAASLRRLHTRIEFRLSGPNSRRRSRRRGRVMPGSVGCEVTSHCRNASKIPRPCWTTTEYAFRAQECLNAFKEKEHDTLRDSLVVLEKQQPDTEKKLHGSANSKKVETRLQTKRPSDRVEELEDTHEKYQVELAQLSEELQSQRDNLSKLREKNRKLRLEYDEFHLRYDGEAYKTAKSTTAGVGRRENEWKARFVTSRKSTKQQAHRALQAVEDYQVGWGWFLRKQDLEGLLEAQEDRATSVLDRMKKLKPMRTIAGAAEAWTTLTTQFDLRDDVTLINAQRDLRNSLFKDGDDLAAHIADLRTKWTTANALGAKVDDADFRMVVLASLPASWDNVVATLYGSKSSTDTIARLLMHWNRINKPKVTPNILA
ncbi:nonmuscle myosin heavy chain b [Coprinopsis cinerea AmutBmut pab1-1]|nr:nonmuscle myosin heavy chain b [Coprinopsis cinerea AmutBmut pab1-1]